jgi:gamma-butyrobetaine dioxygenase
MDARTDRLLEAPLTPDFVTHAWSPLQTVVADTEWVHLTWPDGRTWSAYGLWLAENADGYSLDPIVRESTLEPVDLPAAAGVVARAVVDDDGALDLTWHDGRRSRVHPGWLRHIADGRHIPAAMLPEPRAWTAADLAEPPTIDASGGVGDDVLGRWLELLVTYGLARLSGTPTELETVGEIVGRIGPLRDTNFGPVWSVRADPVPGSTANTGLDLGQHTDLPTREVPPGFQFLHCLENTVAGGWSRMSDGWSVVAALEAEQPAAHEALCTLEWVFANRSPDAEHRWVGPIIDHGGPRQPLTLRAFYPVRLAPHMPPDDVPRAYEALRVFAGYARDPRFQISSPFRPGDLVGFDNRRVLHGRDAFDSAGHRHLRGCYADHDDVYSRLRVLRRHLLA